MVKVSAVRTGAKIKIQIYKSGLSTNYIASSLGYSDRSIINRWSRGETVPSYENLVNLAIVLKCKIADLVAFEDE